MQYFLVVNDGSSDFSVPMRGEAMSSEMARDEAVRLLTEIVQSKITKGDGHMLVGVVKGGAGQAVYRVLLALTCTKLD